MHTAPLICSVNYCICNRGIIVFCVKLWKKGLLHTGCKDGTTILI